ncbi:chromosome segregation protein SMC [Marinicrinis lubricantis]|uniref:Chromosome partition protein Smc n=1 Tax=Marinicrinis lubricantis TaxID=2086470 RepID=A0ABW1IMN8_9BACL
MHLKRLELAGFKSFAERTELEFVQGITAVVGPNGSGKSNISDSIRWVLGEQSARSLRGGNMQDVIFAGSDSRKAVNYGEVSLTLDNTDQQLSLEFSEVTVTRRIHRSGESEYFINKQPCRLRDITELFMDTGIGKESYSIIGQGRIEEILSTRSEDRRGIFEEASGIVKYKTRKKEAQKKLEDTEQNLLRIHDLISEIEDQIEPLREQSEKARTYKQLKEQLKTHEISLYVYQIDEIHGAWQDASAAMERLKNVQLELSAVVSKHDAELEGNRLEIRKLEEEMEQLQQQLLQCSEDLEKGEGQREVFQEREKNLLHNMEQLQHKLDSDAARKDQLTQEMGQMQIKLQELDSKLKQLQTSIAAEGERLKGVAGLTAEDEEDRLKADLLDTLNESAQARNELRYVEQQLDSVQRKMDKLLSENEQSFGQYNTLKADMEQCNQQIMMNAEALEKARNAFTALADQLKNKQSLLEESMVAQRKWEQQLDSMVSRRDTMKEMQNDFDGFQLGVKEVLKARDRAGGLRGIQGAVAELVKVPGHLEKAVETALGGALQHIVMDDEASAREAISFLKKRQLGRATFLPLDVIRGRFIQHSDRQKISEQPGYVGVAVDLVEYEDRYDSIMSSLLGQVIISETLEQANKIAAACQYRYRVVTLDGDVVNAGGSMTGGSMNRKSANLLGRQRQIEEMDEQIVKAGQQLELLKQKSADLKKTVDDGKLELERLRDEGEALRLQEQQLQGEKKRLEAALHQMEAQMGVAKQEADLSSVEQDQLTQKQAELKDKILLTEQKEGQLQELIREAEKARKDSLSVKEHLQGVLTDLKIEAASLQKEKQSTQEQIERWNSDLIRFNQEMGFSSAELERMEKELEELKLQLTKQIEAINAGRLQKQKLMETLEFKRADRLKSNQRLEDAESETKEQRIQLKQIESELHQMEVKANRLDVELENLLKKLSEDYELSYELAKERYPIPEDVQAAQQIVRDLKRQIASLGDVNLGAIDEFQRMSERFDFLSEQKQDLVEAKQKLYLVIQELEQEMSKRFRTTFDQIRIHFVDVFSKLFGGGKADLVLDDPNHLLDTGIEIVAQPPGKKLQNLQLLSGGEKALTAIALLFAILHVKPVPFCVLDEVEAALDEANVARFAQYLREFSQMTQFIVVTHRKGTMEEADVLYGVTMEEGGVSKLVSVRLDEDEPVSA